MVEYTETEKRVAKALLKAPKTVEELMKELSLPMDEVLGALSHMTKLHLVEREGTPTRYRMIEYIMEKVRGGERMDVEPNYRAKMIIEGMSKSEEALRKSMEILETRLKKERIRLFSFEKSEMSRVEEDYVMFFDVDLGTKTFRDLFGIIINYGPTSVELLEPKKIEIKLPEAQDTLNDVATAIHHYVSYLLELGLQRKQ